MKYFIITLLSTSLLSSCVPSQSAPAQFTPEAFVTATLPPTNIPLPTSNASSVTPTSTTDSSIFAQLFPESSVNNELTRIDQQGEVVVQVTPLNLEVSGVTLDFEVSLNTHSVDLSMDLAQHATLETDTGIVVQSVLWDAPRGGHHISGKLVFPASSNGLSILIDVSKLTLQIRDVDAAIRTFEWTLQ